MMVTLFSIISAVVCVICTDSLARTAPLGQVQRFQDCCGLLPQAFVHIRVSLNDSESSPSLPVVGFKFWDRAQAHHHLGFPLFLVPVCWPLDQSRQDDTRNSMQ